MNNRFNNLNPNIWDTPHQQRPISPFVNQPPNFFQGPNNNFQNYPQNFHQNQPIRFPPNQLGPGHGPQGPPFRKFNNQRRPGPACSQRNNNFQNHNQSRTWMKDNVREPDGYQRMDSSSNNNNNNRFRQDDNNSPQPSSESGEPRKYKSLVDQLKAMQNSRKSEGDSSDIDAMCAKNAPEVSKKLLTQLKTMDKDGVKDLIKNPKQPYKKTVLNLQAREKLREQMRKKIKSLGTEGESDSANPIDHDESVDYDRVPESLIAQIARTMPDYDNGEEMDLSESINEDAVVDKDIEVVTQNLGNDFLMGSEMLLMNGFSLLAENDNEDDKMPPLPPDFPEKPPSPPPEPVVSSVDKPWSPLPIPIHTSRLREDEWDIDTARNPDPPMPVQPPPVPVQLPPVPVQLPPVPPIKERNFPSPRPVDHPVEAVAPSAIVDSSIKHVSQPSPKPAHEPVAKSRHPQPSPRPDSAARSMSESSHSHPARPGSAMRTPENPINPPRENSSRAISENATRPIPGSTPKVDQADKPSDETSQAGNPEQGSGQRANETYGEYRRRLAAERENQKTSTHEEEVVDDVDNNRNNNNNNRNNMKNQKNQRKSNDWRDDDRNRGPGNNRQDNWMRNNRNDPNNRQQNRKSRFDQDRGRDRSRNINNNNNNFQQRNNSRDTNRSFDGIRHDRSEEIRGGPNYRFHQDDGTEPSIDRLNTILHPKPAQFKGSFNKRTVRRSRTPMNNSAERDFEDIMQVPLNDVRPCYHTLKKIMELDGEITKVHEKIHGIDKVITNLQTDRLSLQKNFIRLQHDRKVLFDSLIRRTMSKDEEPQAKETPTPGSSQKAQVEKKLQNIVDQKKRKIEEPVEETVKKKPLMVPEVMETTSAAEKAAKLQREREEEERKQKLAEKKRLKQLRLQREEAEKRRLEEKIRREALMTTTVKQESREKSQDKSSGKRMQKSEKQKENVTNKNLLFKRGDLIDPENHVIQEASVNLRKISLTEKQLNVWKSRGSLEIEEEDWPKWSQSLVKVKSEVKVEKEKPENTPKDPLAEDDPLDVSPPTPGSNLPEQDYSEWSGNFNEHTQPIVCIQNINGKHVLAACEDGKLFKYYLSDGKVAHVFSKHTEILNSFLFDNKGHVYTVSSDGFLHKIRFKDFQLIGSENFNEALQVIEKSKAGIFIGTKSGKIYKLKNEQTERESEPICDLAALILCLRASKEGSRNILLVSSRSNAIQVRDANDGLLLRILSEDLTGVHIYDMLVEGSTIYCGTNRNVIFAVDFATGALKKERPCGAGAICVRLYKNHIIAACYDGNIYIFNIDKDDAAINICGPSNMLLAMDLWDNKIIASTKDKTMKIITMPTT